MYKFEYKRAHSVEHARDLAQKSPDNKYLSGGMTLIPTMKSRLVAPSTLIDLVHIPSMNGIDASGQTIFVGSTTTHFDVARNTELASRIPALCYLASHIGDPMVRYRGTIGGSIANNDPAADYPAAMLALGATIVTDRREMPADRFFVDLFETALEDDEVVTAVKFTPPLAASYTKFRSPASRYAIVGVFIAKFLHEVRVAITGAGSSGVFRWTEAEAKLSKRFDKSGLATLAVDPELLLTDIHATAEYRAHLISVMTGRGIDACEGGR